MKPATQLAGAAILINSVTLGSGYCNQNDVLTIDFNPITTLASTDRIYIYFPDGFAQAPSSTSCAEGVPTTSSQSCTYSYYSSGYIQSVLLNSPCASSLDQCSTP